MDFSTVNHTTVLWIFRVVGVFIQTHEIDKLSAANVLGLFTAFSLHGRWRKLIKFNLNQFYVITSVINGNFDGKSDFFPPSILWMSWMSFSIESCPRVIWAINRHIDHDPSHLTFKRGQADEQRDERNPIEKKTQWHYFVVTFWPCGGKPFDITLNGEPTTSRSAWHFLCLFQ